MSTNPIAGIQQTPDLLGIGTDLQSTILSYLSALDLKVTASVCKKLEAVSWQVRGDRGQVKTVRLQPASDDFRMLDPVKNVKRLILTGPVLAGTLRPLFERKEASTLESLVICNSKTPLTVTSFQKISQMPALGQLHLREITINPTHLQGLSQITDLHLSSVGLVPAKPDALQKLIETLARMPHLQRIKIDTPGSSRRNLRLTLNSQNVLQLSSLTKLHTLSCFGSGSSLECLLAQIKTLPALKTVGKGAIRCAFYWLNKFDDTRPRIREQLQQLNTLNRYEIEQLTKLQEEDNTTLLSHYQDLPPVCKQAVLDVFKEGLSMASLSEDLKVLLLSRI